MPPYDPNSMLAALQGQQLTPRAMQALMGEVPVLEGGNLLPSPAGAGAMLPEYVRAMGGATPSMMREAMVPAVNQMKQPLEPMAIILALGGGPGGPATAMAPWVPRVIAGGKSTGPASMGLRKMLQHNEMDKHGWDWLDENTGYDRPPPQRTIDTGLGSHEGATELQIYHDKNAGRTYVIPAGEWQNSEPYYFNGTPDPKEILHHYKALNDDESGFLSQAIQSAVNKPKPPEPQIIPFQKPEKP